MSNVNNVVVYCAPECLTPVEGRPLVHWQLEQLADVENILIVTRCDSSYIMRSVLEMRPDAIFALNHEPNASVLDCMAVGVRCMREPFVYLDGSRPVPAEGIRLMANSECPSIGIRRASADSLICVHLGSAAQGNTVVGFSTVPQEYEWVGMAKLHAEHVEAAPGVESVHKALERFLPLAAVTLDTPEIMGRPDFEMVFDRAMAA